MGQFIYYVLDGILSFFSLALLVYMVISWLIVFEVIKPYDRRWRTAIDILDRITAPILEPFRRLIPPMGGLDLSFLVAVLVIQGMQQVLLPIARDNLVALLGS